MLVHSDPIIVTLLVDGKWIETTPEHPFYTEEKGWVAAGELWKGAHIREADGTPGVLQDILVEYKPQLMYNLTVDQAHTFFVGQDQLLVHNECGAELTLRFEEGMNKRSFARKASALQGLAEEGKLVKTPSSHSRQHNRQYKSDVIERVWRQYGHNPEFRDSAIRRVQTGMQVDHIHDLQLGGQDTWDNLWMLHARTNWRLGNQIEVQMRRLDYGTPIYGVNTEGP